MKHLYIAAALAATVTVSAWSAAPRPGSIVSDSEPSAISLPAQQLKLAESVAENVTVNKAPMAKAPEGDWKVVSTGVWVEGPLASLYSDVPEERWDVPVEESVDVPGWYRIQPYNNSDCTPAVLLGRTDENYLYINAADSEHVYFEPWTPYGAVTITSFTAEGGWALEEGEGTYGTLVDGVIEFPENAIAYTTDDASWYYLKGTIKLHLDKNEAKFYGVSFDVPFCCDVDEIATIKFTKEPDVASVYIAVLDGMTEMSDESAEFIALYGTDVTDMVDTGIVLSFDPDEKGIYSVAYVSLDSEGTVRDSGVKYMFVQNEDSENWESIGQGTFTENIVSGLFSDIESETLTVDIEENVNVKGFYRIKDAYLNHSRNLSYSCDNHSHYLYIHAENPERVYLDYSSLGVEVSPWGKFAAYSLGALYLGTDLEEAAAEQGYFGTADEKTITLPAERIMVSMTDYEKGQFLWIQNDEIVITLPDKVGIESVEAADSEAPAEYFNLQGVRVDKPATGGLYILRQGSKAVKQIIR